MLKYFIMKKTIKIEAIVSLSNFINNKNFLSLVKIKVYRIII